MLSAREDDLEAVGRITAGDASGLETLYDRHATSVYSLAVRILRDSGEAEDVSQEVFAQVWQQATRYEQARGSVAAWMLIITRSRALDRLRRRRAALRPGPGDEVLAEIPALGPSVELIAATDQDVRAARAALASLPELERLAMELAYYQGLTQAEIAQQTGTPLGTVKTRIRNALRRVRQHMNVPGQVQTKTRGGER